MLFQGILRPIGLAWIRIHHRLIRARPARRKQVVLPSHGTLWVDETLNFVGDTCLRTNLLTKLVLDKADAGMVIEICSDNLSAVETIPFMLPNCNCELLSTMHQQGQQTIYVRKCETRSIVTKTQSGRLGRQA